MGYFNFFGQYDYSLDAKHRLNVPSKFRKQIEEDSEGILILTVGVDKCINIYPYALWKTTLEELNKLDTNKPENRQFIRMIGANATDVAIDKQGRIVIPSNLRSYANLGKEVKIVGVFDKIELWNPKEFNTQSSVQMNDLSNLAQKLSQKDD